MTVKQWIKGKSTDQLLNMTAQEFADMAKNVSHLRAVVSRISSAANKRLRALEKAEIKSPAYDESRGKKFSTSGLNEAQLKAEFLRAKQFMSSRTSTVKGAREWREKWRKELEDAGIPTSEEQASKLHSVISRLYDISPAMHDKDFYYEMYQRVEQTINDEPLLTVDELTEKFASEIEDIYYNWFGEKYGYDASEFIL